MSILGTFKKDQASFINKVSMFDNSFQVTQGEKFVSREKNIENAQ